MLFSKYIYRKPSAIKVGFQLIFCLTTLNNNHTTSQPRENVSGQTKRAVAVAMQITIGDTGAIAGVLIYRLAFAGHLYRKPHITAIGYLLFAIAVAMYLYTWTRRENNRRDRLGVESKVAVE